MTTYRTPSGLVVADHRRGLPMPEANDGRDDTIPNANVPGDDVHTADGVDYEPISVGPNSSAGFGNSRVLGLDGEFSPAPPGRGVVPAAWSGWPDGWTPAWSGGDSSFLGQWGRAVDIVFAAIDLNSSILSTMSPYIVKGPEPQEDVPWIVNPEEELYTSWVAFAKEAFWSLQACGELFLYATARYADTNGGRPRRFMILNPATVGLDRVAGQVEFRVGGVPLDPADVLHVKYASWAGDLHGHGPLEVAGARILAAAALTRYAGTMANAGIVPPAVLRHPKRLSRQQMRQMQRDYVAARATGMGLPAVLTEGTELDVLSPDLRQQAVSELQTFSESRISTLLGVPPFLLGLPSDSGAYVNSTNLFDFHWRASLRPKAELFMKALSGWALARGSGVELNRDEYIRPGMFERSQSYSMLIGSGVLTPDEVRVMERFGPAPDGVAPAVLTGATSTGATPPGDVPGTPGRPVITNTQPAS